MTELKIKQADINNNGNQRLMGELGRGGDGVYSKYVSCSVVGVRVLAAGEWRAGTRLFFVFLLFYFLEIVDAV